MPTLREIRLFCKRNKVLMFCVYVAAIYIILNVFVAENNVSLMRFQKSGDSYFDNFLDEKDVEDLRGRGITISGGRQSDKRNNINDLPFVRKINNDNEEFVIDGGKGSKFDDFGDEFYQGDDGEDDVMANDFGVEGNLPKNEFHEEVNDDFDDDDEVKREMLRGKLERFKRLDEIVREEKREFGAYWEKVNKNKQNKSKDGIDLDKNVDNVGDEGDDDMSDKKDEAEKDYLGNVGAADKNDNANDEILDVDFDGKVGNDGFDYIDDDNKEDKNEEENNDGDLSPDKHRDSKGDKVKDTRDSKKEEHGKSSGRKLDPENPKSKGKIAAKDVVNGDSSEKEDVRGKGDHSVALDRVMAQLEMDKEESLEVDLYALNKTVEDVKMPHFVEYGQEGDPGQNSTDYNYPSLPEAMQKMKDEDYKKNYFDLWVSNKIAVHRSLNDPRTEGCRKHHYNITTYPTTSIIIVFHNEAWTTLLRSVHSIIDRTPTTALLEIILVDDFSDDDDLKEPLEVYMSTLGIVRVVRATARLGLIKARNVGFLYAQGDIIVFLDSHIECFDGWFDPLVAPIIRDPKSVTFPIIDIINKDTFGIKILPANNVGSMYFSIMSFSWRRSDLKDQWYYRSPTMPGGLYAISRKWFHHLGAYDPGLQLWGGENLEISFKIWMCGGTLLASACSHVGHVFRMTSPNKSHDFSKAVRANTFRLAEVWLDRYKHFYYEKVNYKVSDFGNVTNQKALRDSLHCKSFDWYLTEIDPKLRKDIDPDGKYSGLMTNRGTGMCLHSDPRIITVKKCDLTQLAQVWQFTSTGFVSNRQTDLVVMEFSSRHRDTNVTTTMYNVKTQPSNRENREDKALFSYDQKTLHLVHNDSKLCLDVEPSGSRAVRLSKCHPKAPIQKWELMTREELQAFHRKKQVPIDWSV